MEKYIRTKDGRILSLNEFKYEKEYHWYRPNEKYLSRLNIDFTCWKWCFDDEYDSIPEVLGKITVEKIKREECKFADEIEDLCDRFVLVDKDDEGPIEQELIGKRYRAMLDVVHMFTIKYSVLAAMFSQRGTFSDSIMPMQTMSVRAVVAVRQSAATKYLLVLFSRCFPSKKNMHRTMTRPKAK